MQVLKVLLVTTTLVDATDDENTPHISGHKHTRDSLTSGESKNERRGPKDSFIIRANAETWDTIPDDIKNQPPDNANWADEIVLLNRWWVKMNSLGS